jgi:hypothetical protein
MTARDTAPGHTGVWLNHQLGRATDFGPEHIEGTV